MNKKAIYSILSTIVAMVVLSVSLVFAIGPKVSADSEIQLVTISASEDFEIDENGNLTYVYISDYDEKTHVTVIVPEGVKNILGYTFRGYNGVISKYLGDNITVSVILPTTLETIGESGFGDSYRLQNVEFNSNITEIGDWAFANSGITSIEIPESVTSIGIGAFCSCDNLTTVKLPSNIDAISAEMFYMCENLISVEIPDSVVSIGDEAFSYCANLKLVKIPDSVDLTSEMCFMYSNENLKIYCGRSKEYANEHWGENWCLINSEYHMSDGSYTYYYANVVYDCNKNIIFDTQDGTAVESQIVCVDSLVAKPTAPTKDGYEFKGWFIGDEEYDFATPVTEDMTLTAKWEAVQTQPEQPETETPTEENAEVNNQNNAGLIAGLVGTSAGILIIAGIVVGIMIAKRRRK